MRAVAALLLLLLCASIQPLMHLAAGSEWALSRVNVVDRSSSSIEVVLNKPGCVAPSALQSYLRRCRLVCRDCGYYVSAYLCSASSSIATYIVFEKLPLPGSGSVEVFPGIKVVPRIVTIESVGPYMATLELRIHWLNTSLELLAKRLGSCGWRVSVRDGVVMATYSRGSLRAALTLAHVGSELYIALAMRSSTTPSRTQVDSLLQGLSKCLGIGLSPSMLRNETSIIVTTRVAASGEELRNALRSALRELESYGVLKLSSRDLEEIMALARPGAAGWSNRIVYFNGSWRYYRQVPTAIPTPITTAMSRALTPPTSSAPARSITTVVSATSIRIHGAATRVTSSVTLHVVSAAVSTSPRRASSVNEAIIALLCVAIAICIAIIARSYLSTKR